MHLVPLSSNLFKTAWFWICAFISITVLISTLKSLLTVLPCNIYLPCHVENLLNVWTMGAFLCERWFHYCLFIITMLLFSLDFLHLQQYFGILWGIGVLGWFHSYQAFLKATKCKILKISEPRIAFHMIK